MEQDSDDITLKRTRRVSQLLQLWRHQDSFKAIFVSAASAKFAAKQKKADVDITAFIDNVIVHLVARPADLLALCAMLNDERTAREFMRYYVRHELADLDVLCALIETPEVFHSLPDDPQWKEVSVLLYGSEKLREYSGHKLTIAELAPLGLDVERPTVRSLVGSAFDARILADEDRARLLEIFPNDAYFRAKLSEPRESSE